MLVRIVPKATGPRPVASGCPPSKRAKCDVATQAATAKRPLAESARVDEDRNPRIPRLGRWPLGPLRRSSHRPFSPLSSLPSVGTIRWPRIVPKDADSAESLKKRTPTNLYNQRPTWLGNAHQELDAAVFAAYGWPPTLSDEDLLARLLELNLARSANG